MRPAPTTLALLAAALLAGPAALAQDAPPAAAAAADPAELRAQLQAAGTELQQTLGSPRAVLDPELREQNRGEVVPALLKMRGLLAEGAEAGVVPPGATTEFDMMLALYGHEETIASLEETAAGDTPEADQAFGALVSAEALAAPDTTGRDAAIDRYAERAEERPEAEAMVGLGGTLLSLPGMEQSQKDRVLSILEDTLTSDAAGQAVAAMKGEAEAEGKLASLVGKPLVLEGSTADGGTLSTADWKGKVILVDFWATWCGPCIAELPEVIDTYQEYKDQGLEVLGVSCDDGPADVNAFVAGREGMTWPHLIEEDQGGWHPLATEYGVRGIPTMFLIDKEGIVRSVTARQNYQQLIPQLLAEAPAEGTPAAGDDAG